MKRTQRPSDKCNNCYRDRLQCDGNTPNCGRCEFDGGKFRSGSRITTRSEKRSGSSSRIIRRSSVLSKTSPPMEKAYATRTSGDAARSWAYAQVE